MNKISAVILDDEIDSVDLLALQLEKKFPYITPVSKFTNPIQALDEMLEMQPDLLFLDIEMPVLNGFELLEKLMPLKTKVIFITAYNQYAIKAFKYNAIDYLVKPLSTEDLVASVEKVIAHNPPNEEQLKYLQRKIQGEAISKIAVSAKNGIEFIYFKDIIYLEASGNYSKLFMNNDNKFTITKTLKEIQEIFEEKNFFRIHRQYIVNLNLVKFFNKIDCTLLMENDVELPVARILKDKFIEKFNLL